MINNNGNQITLEKVLIIALLLSALMAIFLSYFFEQQDDIENTALKSVAANFSSQLTVIRSQWLMDKKPRHVDIEIKDNSKILYKQITVNRNGWVDVKAKPNICENIWLLIMDRPLAFFNMPIGAVLLTKGHREDNKNQEYGHICRYTVKNNDYFEYNSTNGNVSQVKNDTKL